MSRRGKESLQPRGESKPDNWNDRLQILNPDTSHGEEASREQAGWHAARVFSEGEQHHIVDDDAESDRRNEPRIGSTGYERAYGGTFYNDAPYCASQQGQNNRSGERPSERDPERKA